MTILKRYWQLYELNENVYNQEICAKNVNCQMLHPEKERLQLAFKGLYWSMSLCECQQEAHSTGRDLLWQSLYHRGF